MSEIIYELEKIAESAQAAFGDFSAAQINWKPGAESWSVGQCFDHLIKSNELFFDELDRIAGGTKRSSFLEKWSPLSGVFGSLLINSLKKDERKFKAPTKRIVPPSEIDEKIVEKFGSHQAELIEKIERTGAADWDGVKVTSPFMALMTYKLSDGYKVIVEHEKRHLRQAERVTQAENFPR